jgi:insulysin
MPTHKAPLFVSCTLLLFTSMQAIEKPAYVVIEDKATLPILTPALEDRKVEKLVLSNGLRVLLISDPGADQSAAGLAVESGSWDDPKEYPGMAHFLEHMLFMGTEKYPKEFEYTQFIYDHGGKYNAFTSPDRTVYMFSVNNDAFEEAADRFGHFFIDPLLAPHCIARELHAVDQEHAKNIEHDGWRQYMIFKEMGNPNHPHSTFSTGNAKTLSGIPQRALKHWYESHYSANRMHLAMVSPLPLDKMKEVAINVFSSVKNFEVQKKLIPSEFTSARQRGHMFFIKPVKEIKQLFLSWEVPAEFASDKDRQAPEIVAYILNRDTEDSLAQALKEQKIAESVHASCDRFRKDALLFTIDINLTDKGMTHIDQAIQNVFEAIARLKAEGVPKYLFDELHAISTLNYLYQSRDDAFKSIMDIVAEMPYEDLSTYPQKTHIPTQYDPVFLSSFIHTLKAGSCLYSILADPEKTGVQPNKKEKWMNAEYAIKKMGGSSLAAWDAVHLNPKIQLPIANPYLPENIALIDLNQRVYDTKSPLLIRNDDKSCIYYIQDVRYRVPEVACVFTFKSPLIDNSASSQVLLDLYAHALKEKLSIPFSHASTAGLQSNIGSDRLSLKLVMQGFSDKAPLLMHAIFKEMKHVCCSQDEFDIYISSYADEYNNSTKDLPVVQAIHQLNGLILHMPTNEEKAAAVRSITLEEFNQFSSQLFSSIYTQALLYGNLSEQTAHNLDSELHEILRSDAYPLSEHPKEQFLLLSDASRPRKIEQSTERQGNGVVLLLQEGAYSFEKRGIQQILGTALHDAFFDTLRTKQQTAYFAKAWNTEEQRQLLQYFAVQSSTHSAPDLLARFELFLEEYDKSLSEKISKERFESLKENLITLISMPPENMSLMAMQLNKFAFDYEDFFWIDKRIDSLKALKYERFSEVAHSLLSRNNSRRLAIMIEGVLQPENDFRYEQISKHDTERLGTFISIK